jgi:hypothetical protein
MRLDEISREPLRELCCLARVTQRVLIAMTVALSACRGRHEIEYVQFTLPGFSVELPDMGRAPQRERRTYRDGEIVIGDAALPPRR